MDYDESCIVPNEKTYPIQWTEHGTSALVVINSLLP